MAQRDDAKTIAAPTLVKRLKEEVEAYNASCYWPGPWTLELERSTQLVGREADIGELIYLIRDKSLTVLSGDSGVGKSSLLLAGLIPALRADGYKTLICRDWKDDRGEASRARGLDGLSDFLTGRFASGLSDLGITVPNPDSLITYLDDAFGSEVVLILDQFEEVIRQQPQLFADLCDWIEAVVENSQVRVLISLRSEYAHRLQDLRVGAYRREDYAIPAIRDEDLIGEIVLSGKRSESGSPVEPKEVISKAAADLIVSEWVTAGASGRRSRVRLLHLQALLFSLWTRQPSGAGITADDVEKFLADAREKARKFHARAMGSEGTRSLTKRDLAIGVFDWALANVVGVHVELCGNLFDAVRGDHFVDVPLREGILRALVRLAEHLSSGGYKVEQEEVHLAELVLSDELLTLGFFDDSDNNDDPEAEALSVIFGFTELTGRGDFDWASAPTRDLEAQLHSINPKIADTVRKSGVTAGALLGTSPKEVLIEECRRFFIALEWLRMGALVRSSPSDKGRNFVTLSHDGFGRGLNEWADANDARPGAALHAITASFGKAFNWPMAREQDPKLNPLYRRDDGHPALFVNVRWRSCRVVGTSDKNLQIRNVVFMNCDFRGTTFQYCTLQGVTFINCLMDGVQFEECRIIGRATVLENANPSTTKERELPSFFWEDQDEVVATLNHYQFGLPATAQNLFSKTSGESVRVVEIVEPEPNHDRFEYQVSGDDVTALAEKQNGGLVLYGGRLSSLAFYRCDFDQTAEVSLRYVAGTSLDFFEHEGGRVELFDVALRGVTISPPITASLDGAQAIHVEFEAVDSHLENVWFSSGLEGTAEIKNSIVWQLFNGSQASGAFNVVIDEDSPHLGIVNVPADQVLGPPMEKRYPDDAANWYEESIREFVGRIDYRSPQENRAYRQRMGDVMDDLTDEESDDE